MDGSLKNSKGLKNLIISTKGLLSISLIYIKVFKKLHHYLNPTSCRSHEITYNTDF